MPANDPNNAAAGSGIGCWLSRALSELTFLGEDFNLNSLRGEMFQPRIWFEIAVRLMLVSAETMASVVSGDQGLVWQELANKLGAWHLFSYADRLLAGSPHGTLTAIAEQMSQVDPFTAVWLTEGLGYSYARNALTELRRPGLFKTQEASRLPVRLMVPLHTGSGLAFAEATLHGADLSLLPERLRQLWWFCLENARECYAEMAFEALGVVAITLFPQLVAPIGQELTLSAKHLVAYFWHGVGRGLYFLPSTFFPVSIARGDALDLTQQLPITDEGRRNALSGFAWAMTLVNIRHPQVIAQCLSDHERQIVDFDAFSNGVTSAMRIWSLVAPDDPHLELLMNFPSSVKLWDQQSRKHSEGVPPPDAPGGLFRVPADIPCWIC